MENSETERMEAEIIKQQILSGVYIYVGQRIAVTSLIKNCHTHQGQNQNLPFHCSSCIGTFDLGIRTNAATVGQITDDRIMNEILSGAATTLFLDIQNMSVVEAGRLCDGSRLLTMKRNGPNNGSQNGTNDSNEQLSVSSGMIAVEFQRRIQSFQERFGLYGNADDEFEKNYIADYDLKIGYFPHIFFRSMPNVQHAARESLWIYQALMGDGDLPKHYPGSVDRLLRSIKRSLSMRRGDQRSSKLGGACMSNYVADFVSHTIYPLLISCAITRALGNSSRFYHAVQEFQFRGRHSPNGDLILSEVIRGEVITTTAWHHDQFPDVGSVLENLCRQWYKTAITDKSPEISGIRLEVPDHEKNLRPPQVQALNLAQQEMVTEIPERSSTSTSWPFADSPTTSQNRMTGADSPGPSQEFSPVSESEAFDDFVMPVE